MSVRELDVWMQWGPGKERQVGTLVYSEDGYRFQFASAWVADGIELSPKFRRGAGLLGPWPTLPGVFAGSLPDHWGRFVMDRRARTAGVAFKSDLDRLAFLGDGTGGALVYRPPLEDASSQTTAVKLRDLAKQTARLLDGEIAELSQQVALAASSMGGTRPKYTIAIKGSRYYVGPPPDGAELWLVKLPAKQDAPDVGVIEHAYMSMAQEAGINVPALRLLDGTLFGIRRFDRDGQQRKHVMTFADIFDMGDLLNTYATSYRDLLKTTLSVAGASATREMFRRMVFNILSHNRDDHVRNHAFLCDARGVWSLSPAYDLTFAEGPNNWHSLVVGEGMNPTRADVEALARELDVDDANESIEAVTEAIGRWPKLAKAAGLSASRIKAIAERHESVADHFKTRP